MLDWLDIINQEGISTLAVVAKKTKQSIRPVGIARQIGCL